MKKNLLTGDTPTGRLHLGHLVGSLENRVLLQDEYNCYFMIANIHAFTTPLNDSFNIKKLAIEMVIDYLSVGIDPEKSVIFIESDVPAIFELAIFFSMMIYYPRLIRNPTIKEEINTKQLGENYAMGFLCYPILQVADILAFKADVVPVGEDQEPHIELAREVARKFYNSHCGISQEMANNHAELNNVDPDSSYYQLGKIFPIPKCLLGRVNKLIGIGAPECGVFKKMSKSLNNAIYLSDSSDVVAKKINSMYTDPLRIKKTDRGTIENNPLWIFHDVFNYDHEWVREAKNMYREGKIGDVECKKRLIDAINAILDPIRLKRKEWGEGDVYDILKRGAEMANRIAQDTLASVKSAANLVY